MKRVSARELLDLRERSWGGRLGGVSLVAEVETKHGHAEQVAKVLGRVYRGRVDAGRDPGLVFEKWPACTAVAIAWIAAERYEKGTFWRYLWEAVGHDGHVDDQSYWGQGFLDALRQLELPAFPELPMRYVGPILMHSGIPTYCLDDYFRLLSHQRHVTPGLDAESFLSWATTPGRELRLHELDVPARRFLQYGGDFALDVVDRSLDLLDRLQRSPDDVGPVGLPARFVNRAVRLVEDGLLSVGPVSAGRRRESVERPRLVLDPFGNGVEIRLPAIGDVPDGVASWHITADAERAVVRSRAEWVGAVEGTPATSYPLPGPVRTVLVSLAGSELQAELQVVDPRDPLLVFAEDGRQIPASVPLPPEPVWVLHPEDRDLTVDGPVDERAEAAMPLGWPGWRLRLLALDEVRSIGLDRARTVRGFVRPRVVTGQPVRGVTTPYGSPVHADPPAVWLPGIGAETTWNVEVRSSGEGGVIASRSVTSGGPVSVDDLWDGLPRPLAGAYDVVVRGPLGRGTRRSVVVAEDLRVSFKPAVRLFAAGGLSAAEADVRAAPGARVVPHALHFGARERARVVSYQAPSSSEPLVVTPPHLEVLHQHPDAGAVWSAGPLRLASESFGEPGDLLVRLPEASSLPALDVLTSSGSTQTLEPSGAQRGGMARYSLVKIRDTVEQFKRADVLLGETPLLFVRPRRLATGVSDEGGHLLLRDAVEIEGLTAGVYPVTAPWRRPVLLPVTGNRIELPEELRDAGPVRVLLQVEDPWAFTDWPRWPSGQVFTCDRPGVYEAGDEEETALGTFLMGDAAPPTRVERMERLWTIVDLDDDLQGSGAAPYIAGPCERRLLAAPRAALGALPAAMLPAERVVPLLVRTGLATVALEVDGPGLDRRVVRELWSAAPAAAVLPAAFGDVHWLDAARDVCGETLDTILSEGRDPHAGVGRFGPEAARLAHMSPQQLESAWSAAGVVPQALLDPDTRLAAARRLFDSRRSTMAMSLARQAADLLAHVRQVVETSRFPGLGEQIGRRTPDRTAASWQLLPAASAALALAARLAARGDEGAISAERSLRKWWLPLATLAPELTGIDLVVAELLLSARTLEWPPTPPDEDV
ncbi:hypothetical protein [Spirillospora sp. NPDC048819]|uniref:hypothetical protein n=1 Tax=Spirillospora sp. NPDC048819 TaxID=3155268 RepID=UPI0033FA631E